jgi:hypothetical protein
VVLDDFYKMIRNAQIALSKKYRFIERDKLAGIYPIGGDSFWMFIPASKENKIVGDSFSFSINAIRNIKKISTKNLPFWGWIYASAFTRP